ncbi:MAG: PAS domain S-box protein [Actinomycetes bacterium]
MTGLRWVDGVGADLVRGAELVVADVADVADVGGADCGPGLMVCDRKGVVVAADDDAGLLLGLGWEQLVGLAPLDSRWSAVSERGLPVHVERSATIRALSGGEPVDDFLMGVLILDGASAGRTRWLSVAAHPVGVPPAGVVTVITDVSGTARGQMAGETLLATYRRQTEDARNVAVRTDEQVRSSQELLAAEQRFTSLFYGHAAVMLLIDPGTGDIVDANQAAADFYGYTTDEMQSMLIDQINVLPDEQVALRRAQALAGDLNHFVFPHLLADGTIRSVQVHSSPIVDSDRTLLFSIITDVTERERVEAQLRQAAAVFDNTLEAVVITDPAGVVTGANRAFSELTGWDSESIVGQHTSVLGNASRDARTAAWFRGTVRAQAGVRGEVSIRHADGTESPALLSVSAVPGPMGEVTGYVGVLADIGERVRAERELAEAAEQLESARSALAVENERRELVLSGTRVGLWDWNMQTGEEVFDERWSQILGYQLDELEPVDTNTWDRLCHPDDLTRATDLVAQYSQGLLPYYDAEVRMKHRDGRWVWVRDRGKIVQWDSDGRPVRMTGSHEDITELVEARELVQAERARLRATLDSLIDPHVLLDAARDESGTIVDFVYTDANPAACAYNGVDYHDMVGARLLDLVPGHETSLLESYRQVVETGESLALDDVPYDRGVPGCQQRFYDLRATRVGDGLSCTWRDTTDRHTAAVALAEAETKYRMLAENASDVVAHLDTGTVLTWVSPSIKSVLGWAPGQLLGRRASEFIHPEDLGALSVWRTQAFAGWTVPAFELRLLSADGGDRWMSLHTRPTTGADGVVDGAVVGLRDIHQEVLAREQLARSEQTFRLAMDGAPLGMAVVGLHGRLMEVNTVLCDMVGRDAKWMGEHCESDFVHRDALEAGLTARDRLLAGGIDYTIYEGRLITAAGTVLWVQHSLALIRDEHNMPLFYVSQYQDITDARAARAELAYHASHDSLTGLINRNQLQRHIETVLGRGLHPAGIPALLYCDLDHFKTINDTHGHAGGDAVLRVTAERMAAALREGDEVARLGGDEFVVLLAEVPDPDAATAVARKIRTAVAKAIPLGTEQVTISMSIGIALATPGIEAHRLLRNADAALYEAKHSGRDQTAVFNQP